MKLPQKVMQELALKQELTEFSQVFYHQEMPRLQLKLSNILEFSTDSSKTAAVGMIDSCVMKNIKASTT